MEERVRENSTDRQNRKIDEKIKASITQYQHKDDHEISVRIRQLEDEWDIERALEVNMPIVALIGLALAVFVNSWWLIFPAFVLLFFLQHALQGWCPPLPIFRGLGFRTRKEIDKEKFALKYLRGDFDHLIGYEKSHMDPNTLFRVISH